MSFQTRRGSYDFWAQGDVAAVVLTIIFLAMALAASIHIVFEPKTNLSAEEAVALSGP